MLLSGWIDLFRTRLKKKRRSNKSRRSRQGSEALEPRQLLTAISWDGGGDGTTFTDPNNWSTDTVPGAADDATIGSPFGSAFTVSLGSNISLNSLTMTSDDATLSFNPGRVLTLNSNSTVQAGSIELPDGSRINGAGGLTNEGAILVTGNAHIVPGSFSQNGTLTVGATSAFVTLTVDDVVNSGTIELGNGTTSTATIQVNNGHTLTNAATGNLNTDGPAASQSRVLGNLTNDGDVSVTNIFEFNSNGTTLLNRGDIDVNPGGSAVLGSTSTVTFIQESGSLTNNGEFSTAPQETIQFDGGTIDGSNPIEMFFGTFKLAAGNTQPFSVEATGTVRLEGDLASGQSFSVFANGATSGQLTVDTDFTNAGNVSLSGMPGATGGVTLSAGNASVVTNQATGTIDVSGSGSFFVNVTDLVNEGTIHLARDLTLTGSRSITNEGQFNIDAANTLHLQNSFGVPEFIQQAGTLNNDGILDLTSAAFTFNGGDIDNPFSMSSGTLTIAPANANPMEVNVDGSFNLQSDLKSGQTVNVEAFNTAQASLRVKDGFVNEGLITLGSLPGATGSVAISSVSGVAAMTNAAGGEIDVNDGGTFFLTVNDFTNEGTVNLGRDLTFQGSRTLTNNGDFNVEAGSTLHLQNNFGAPQFEQDGGTLNNSGVVDLTAASFTFNGGDIVGDIEMSSGNLTIDPANPNPIDVNSDGVLNLNSNLQSGQTINVRAFNATQASLRVNNDFVNEGLITLGAIGGATGSVAINTVSGVSEIRNAAGGVIDVNDGGSFFLTAGELINEGTFDLGRDLTLQGTRKITNDGQFNVESGSTLHLQNSFGAPEFVQQSGTLNNIGTVDLTAANFTFDGGGIAGPISMSSGTLAIDPANPNPIEVNSDGILNLASNLQSGQTINVRAFNTAQASLRVNDNFVNEGLITLGEVGGATGSVSITTSSGTAIRNAVGGVIDIDDGGTFFLPISSFLNQGTVNLGRDFEVSQGREVINEGQFHVEPGAELEVRNSFGAGKFSHDGGNLDIEGDFTVLGGSFVFNDGSVTGANAEIPFTNGSLEIGAANNNAAAFRVNNGITNLLTDLNENQTVTIASQGAASSTLIVPTPFSNSGTIRFDDNAATTGFRKIRHNTTSGDITNETTGRIEGIGEVETGTVINDGVIAPGSDLGTLTIDADLIQSATGLLEIAIGASELDFGDVEHDVTLDGTLSLGLAGGFIPALGDSFQVMAFPNVSGDFFDVIGTDVGNGTILEKATNANDVTITVRIPPNLTIDNVVTVEGDAGTVDAIFTISLEQTGNPVTVDFETIANTANELEDYLATAGSVRFAANETSRTIAVPVVGDLRDEDSEDLEVHLQNPHNAVIDDAVGVGTIQDNGDPQPVAEFATAASSADESVSPREIEVLLSRPSGVEVTVDFTISGGTATAGDDYTLANGTLVFAPDQLSQIISIPIIDETDVEASETIELTLSGSTRSSIGATNVHTVTIVNDDAPQIINPINDVSVNEDAADTVIDITDVFNSNTVPFTVSSSDPALVSASLNGLDLTLDYIANANGTATISLTAGEPGLQTTEFFEVTVNQVNDAGTFGGDLAATINEDSNAAGTATFADAADGYSTLNFVLETGAPNGTATIDSDGSWTYSPNANFNGTDEFTVKVTDDDGNEETQTISLTIDQVNDAGTFGGDLAATINEDTNAAGTATFADAADGYSTLNFVLETGATKGIATIDSNGSWTYSPNANFNGADEFTVKVTDDDGNEETQTISLTIDQINDAGTFGGDLAATINEDTNAAGTATFADAADGYSTLNFVLETAAANGTATIDSNGSWTYSPNANFNGADEFTVRVTDDDGNEETQTISLTIDQVNDAGTFGGDLAATINEDSNAAGTATFADAADGYSTLNFVLETGATNGTATIDSDGSWTYSPNANFNGTDEFTVKVTDDDGNEETQTISLTIDQVNDAGTFGGDLAATINEDTNAAGTATFADAADGYSTLNFVLETGATKGIATIDSNGSWTYSPNANFNGADEFTVKVTDDDGNEETQTISLTIDQVNDTGTFGGDLAATINEDSNAAGTATFADAADGYSTLNFVLETAAANGTATIDSNGSWTYSPNANFNGADEFTVRVTDDDGNEETQTISLTIDQVNDAGTFGGDLAATINEDTNAAGTATFADAADGYSTLNFLLETAATNGTATVDSDGSWTYSPNANFNGTDEFTVKVTDDDGNEETQTISLTIDQVNDAGTFGGDLAATINEDANAAGTATFADAADGYSTLNFVLETGATKGIATIDSNGSWTYSPNANFNGTDEFTVKVTDDDGNEETQTISLTIDQVNDAGTFGGDLAATINEDTNAAGTATFADAADGYSTLNFLLETAATNGTATVDSDGSWTYSPNANFNGTDEFTVKVTDDDGNEETQTISLTIDQVNDAGTFGGDLAATINEDSNAAGTATFADAADGYSTLNFVLETAAANGTATINSDGNWTYSPERQLQRNR